MGIMAIILILTIVSAIFIYITVRVLEFAFKKSIMKYIFVLLPLIAIGCYALLYVLVNYLKYDGCGGFMFWFIITVILGAYSLIIIFSVIEKLYKKLSCK